MVSIIALWAGSLVALVAAPAQAAQAPGHDVPAWSTGWSWTYQTSFRYQADGTDVTINENVSYTVAGTETFQGQDAYRLTISGSITGGNGSVAIDGLGNASLSGFSGSVTGTRLVRRSDLALLREHQRQNLRARASVSFLGTDVTAAIDLTMTPSGGWRTRDFPLNAGDTWHNDESIAYSGGFSYDAGSVGGSGSDTFEGTLPFAGPSNVTATNVSVPIGTVTTSRVRAVSEDGQTVDDLWWSPTHRNDAKEVMQLPLDGARLTITRNLSGSSTPAPTTVLTQTVTPSLSCAGGAVTVTGRHSGGASGVLVTAVLDQSPVRPGQRLTASTRTTAGGGYSITLTAPVESDGMAKRGSRGNWGIVVSGGGASNAGTLVVTGQSCTTLTVHGDTSAPQGGTAEVSARLEDLAGGPVSGRAITFTLSDGDAVTARTDATGVAEVALPVAGPPRKATLSASFAGSADQAGATTSTPFVIGRVATRTTVTASPSPATVGEPVTFTAAVVPELAGDPGGEVQFFVDGAAFGGPVAVADGTATSAGISTLALGTHEVTAEYRGDDDHAGSVSPTASFLVRNPLLASSTTQSSAPNPAVYGQPVTLTSTVRGTAAGGMPTGTVVFTEGGSPLGTATLGDDGVASLDVTTWGAGRHTVVATYSGDDTYAASVAAPREVTIEKAGVEVELDVPAASRPVSGQALAITARVLPVAPGAGVPDGSLQLLVDGAERGDPVPLESGAAAFPATTLRAGDHTVAVAYSGSANFEGGTDSLRQTVAPADTVTTLVASPSPSVEDQEVELTATVAAVAPGAGAPSGTVTFLAAGEPIGAAPLRSTDDGTQATLAVSDLAPGSYVLTAQYDGDDDYRASQAEPTDHTVIAAATVVATTTALTSSRNPSSYGEMIDFHATVTAADGSVPTGAVQFSVDGTDVGGPVPLDAGGRATSVVLASPDPGDHTVIAAFVPDAGFSRSGATLTQSVVGAGVDLVVTSSAPASGYGEAVSFTATAASQRAGTGQPSGYVQFAVDGQPLGDAVALAEGRATSPTVADLAPGEHTVTALYSGDRHFVPASTSVTQSVATLPTTTTLTAATTAPVFGDPVALTATVVPTNGALGAALGAPGGTVAFVEGDTVLATVPLEPAAGARAEATATLTGLGAGSHAVRAVYSGSDDFSASQSVATTIAVAKRPTAIHATNAAVRLVPFGLPLGRLQADVHSDYVPVPGVRVVFRIGGRTVCTVTADDAGVALCDASRHLLALVLAGGYTATFAGDENHLPATDRGAVL
ncbi:Ig-like domain repeat protein [Nocardioides sp. SYSU DS0663]|uniref:Ig-like domain repeat protein n=1 Tax=Nocardioides sp. SYSU DS0663 TaxID=3416445 RepID=UPI003F4B3A10